MTVGELKKILADVDDNVEIELDIEDEDVVAECWAGQLKDVLVKQGRVEFRDWLAE